MKSRVRIKSKQMPFAEKKALCERCQCDACLVDADELKGFRQIVDCDIWNENISPLTMWMIRKKYGIRV
jgi:hypothetical protein